MSRTTQPIRKADDVQKLLAHLRNDNSRNAPRNYVLGVMGVHTALRISDLLQVKWEDVYDFKRQRFNQYLELVESKTKKCRTIRLHKDVIEALKALLPHRRGSFLFSGNRAEVMGDGTAEYPPISRSQAHRIISGAAEAAGIEQRVSCHSLRKTFGYHAVKAGTPIPVIMEIYNHSSYAVTRRYLGLVQDDMDKVYLDLKFA